MAKKQVQQDYFNTIVKENMEEFSMSAEEAINDAIEQLKSQNIDTSNICRATPDEINDFLDSIKKLDGFNETYKNDTDNEAINLLIKSIRERFQKDLSYRVLATKQLTANEIFLKLISKFQQNQSVIINLLQLYSLYLTNQTDILTVDSIKSLIELLKLNSNDDLNEYHVLFLVNLLKCLNTSCLLCEKNRQMYVENGLCELLLSLFQKYKKFNLILIEICQLIRNLLLDDDMRVEFGHSHEHAKYIASQLNGLDVLLSIGLSNEELSGETLAGIMLTLSKLAVRNEYCQEISDKGGLNFVIKCLTEEHLQNQALLKSALSLLKSICNNDSVKCEATKLNCVFLIIQVLSKYCANPFICELGCAALSTILLRNLDACEELVKLDGDLILMQVLSLHLTKPKVTKMCCLAIRNIVSRNKSLGEKLINANIEEPLRKVLNQNDQSCYEEAKAALRDFNFNVELKELWTGSGRQLAN